VLPISVDLARVRVVLVGNGNAACRRLALLDRAGARRLEIYAVAPAPELTAAAGTRLRRRPPRPREISRAQLVFLAGVGESDATRLRHIADDAGVLLNVEDDIGRSDFHSSAVVRRGDLTLSISTGGRSPGLAAAIRRRIEAGLDPEWGARLDRAAVLRARWHAADADAATIAELTIACLDREGRIAPRGGSR
jgi:precorrin-2 dehydrogenase/sirohydrochlorin ferrochelatase